VSDHSFEVRALGVEVSNWGRWGADDEIGTLNYITSSKRRDAASLVRKGAVFSLQIPMGANGPVSGPLRINPMHMMVASGTDTVPVVELADGARATDDVMFLFLQSGTEWDALSHVYYDAQLYNGFPASEVDSRGAQRLGIDKTCSAYVSRGVLLDVARWRCVDCLDTNDRIDGDVLEAVAATEHVDVGEGDILLIRTGIMSEYARTGRWDRYRGSHPGLHPTAVRWLHDRRIAAVASDNGAVESVDKAREPLAIPLHMVALRDMGLPLGESFFLEDLADDCADDGVYECFLVAPALRVTGGVGSPVNPIAMK
jgi:kynurenine formamidase